VKHPADVTGSRFLVGSASAMIGVAVAGMYESILIIMHLLGQAPKGCLAAPRSKLCETSFGGPSLRRQPEKIPSGNDPKSHPKAHGPSRDHRH
jgi:hypothetical protein